MSQSESRSGVWVVLDLDAKKRGSLEEALAALATYLHGRHVKLTVVFSSPPIGWLRDALIGDGVDVRTLDFRRPTRGFLRFAKWMAVSPPDLVHFHFVRSHSPLIPLARATGAPVVLHDHITLGQAVPPYQERSSRTKALLRPFKRLHAATLGRCVDARLAVSWFVAASVIDAEHVGTERIEVIPNGVDTARFLKGDPLKLRLSLQVGTAPVVACVSRISPEKGVDLLIRALARVPERAALLLAGTGPDTEKCRDLAKSLGLEDRVHFLGSRDDVENVYAAADVVVMPSLWDEAFGLCVVEAMAAGKPVVVTDSGAMPELIANGACGAIVPKRDDAALAGAISLLLRDREHAAALGHEARRRALTLYRLERWVEDVVGVYERFVPALFAGATQDQVVQFEAPSTTTTLLAERDLSQQKPLAAAG